MVKKSLAAVGFKTDFTSSDRNPINAIIHYAKKSGTTPMNVKEKSLVQVSIFELTQCSAGNIRTAELRSLDTEWKILLSLCSTTESM